jgi:hypothetical protein
VLQGWLVGDATGLELVRRGINNLRSLGAHARMPYWLSLLADVLARNGLAVDARGTLDGAVVIATVNVDLWWLPEVMRMRAAYDEPSAAIERLRSAARQAAAQGSVALVHRCQADLEALGVRLV